MTQQRTNVELADESTPYRLPELCEMCAVRAEFVVEMVELGILVPTGSSPSNWHFGVTAIMRLKKARRLRRDLNINLAGVAVTLDLLDALEHERMRTRALERLVRRFTDDY